MNMTKREKAFLTLTGLFIALLVVANIIAVKIIAIGPLFVPAAVISYALTFTITDTISEIWGKERTGFLIKIGFISSILITILIRIAIHWPAAPFWKLQDSFAALFGPNLRVVLASIVAYLVSQYHDVWAFHFWKRKTDGKHLWLRNNMSTVVSQFLDTTIFITLAFYGTMPVLQMIFAQYVVKIIIAIIDTPLVYLTVHTVKTYCQPGRNEIELGDYNAH